MAGAIEVKVIKPQRFKNEAFRAALQAAAKEVSHELVLDFRETTRSWKTKPKFEAIVSVEPNVEILVGTDDEIYGYVNDGTEPHTIRPKGNYPLRFQWGGKGSYRPKTKPRVIGSTPGGSFGPEVHLPVVHHPGTKAREFDATIQKKWRKPFMARMQRAMSEAARASGHGIP